MPQKLAMLQIVDRIETAYFHVNLLLLLLLTLFLVLFIVINLEMVRCQLRVDWHIVEFLAIHY